MTQIKQIGAVPEMPKLPGATGSEVPRVLGEIMEWQSDGRLSQLADGRYYMADTKHENVHENRGSRRFENHTDSHKDNHTDRTDKNDNHVDRGPKPPPEPRDPDRCRGRGCL